MEFVVQKSRRRKSSGGTGRDIWKGREMESEGLRLWQLPQANLPLPQATHPKEAETSREIQAIHPPTLWPSSRDLKERTPGVSLPTSSQPLCREPSLNPGTTNIAMWPGKSQGNSCSWFCISCHSIYGVHNSQGGIMNYRIFKYLQKLRGYHAQHRSIQNVPPISIWFHSVCQGNRVGQVALVCGIC